MYIRTRLNQAADTTGETITAFFNGKQKTSPYDYELNALPNHKKAASYFLDNTEFTEEYTSLERGYKLEISFKKGGLK